MKQTLLTPLAAFALLAAGPAAAVDIKLTEILTDHKFERPVALITSPDGSNRQFLVEQTGKIKILKQGGGEPKVFLDFSDRKMAAKEFEEGLLGLAFHPKYKENGKFYVYYSQQGPKRTVLSEIQVSKDDPDAADLSTERIFLQCQQPDWNHNGGNILFGPQDGFLYVCIGDGGMRNGVFQLAQKLERWNGKVLRIDVDGASPGREYGIPADNPFVETPFACPEIYALGIRNPWGAWIDPQNGDFWLADVGQDLYEEVDLIVKGGNYGWEFREGLHKYAGRDLLMGALGINKLDPPDGVKFIDPIWEYGRLDGFSITGGFVYRGSKVPALKDHYIVGDWKLGNIWGLKKTGADSVDAQQLLKPGQESKIQPTGFYPDLDGEVIMLNWDGRIFRFESGT